MCTNCDFVHLHLHTEYSLLDGFARIDKAVSYAKELGMPALGITDHGTMFGVIDFYRACKAADITPVIGVEAYITDDHRAKGGDVNSKAHHLLLLAQNMVGYRNLLQLSSIAQLEGFYYRPRIDKELLARHSEGLIGTTGCLAAEVPRLFEHNREKEAEQMMGVYQDIFGVGNFYAELQGHDIAKLNQLNEWLIPTAQRLNIPLLATNDVHYVRASDVQAHDTLLCIQMGTTKDDPKRMRMDGSSYYMKTQQEMWDLFGAYPSALSNTLAIAERCTEINLEKDEYHLPVFPVPARFENAATYLEYLCERGLHWRYGDRAYHSQYIDRLHHELKIINSMGFATYFLIVWDLCQFAQATDIWWNVRGSGAGSMVAYVLGITNLDPLENGLIFERFLNPGRVSMPDFDLDFPEDRRMEMIDYCCRKYGEDKVAAIITFGTLGAKGAIKDVGRALNVELREVDRITRVIPTNPSLPPLKVLISEDSEKNIPELRDIYLKNQMAKAIIDTAIDLEGVPRHASTHAAGIIVADKPLAEYIPLHRPTKGNAEDSPVKMVTQFPMETAESIGLLKIDFLGLSTLTILRKACDLIEKHYQIKFDMSNIPIKADPDNPDITRQVEEMFEMIGRGETIGVFQIESSGMRQMLTEMLPKTFEHIIAAISLYRPGPMDYIPEYNARMHGKTEVVYHHEKLKTILGNTYGICVYQEQIMQIGAELFGYSLGEADLMRRAVSKKKEKDLLQHRQIFRERGPQFGVDETAANKIFDDIEFFARYGFNKCVVGSTKIIDPQTGRLHRVEELATGQANFAQTLSLNTDDLRLEARPITAVMNNGVKPIYRLTTQTGRQIEATANHPFYTLEGWRLLAELQINDRLAVPRQIPTPPRNSVAILPMSGDKENLPEAVFELNQRQLETFLSQISYQTPSLKIAHQLQHLLLRVGQLSKIEALREGYEIVVFEPHPQDIQGDIYWDKVVSIEYIGEQTTYDLSIEKNHNFIANDIVVHNSHAADYAVITCQTAYLKCHFPHEYMTALMSVYYDNSTKVSVFIQDCRRMGIEVLPPDVNYSVQDFDIQHTAEAKAIRFGLGAIKNVGESTIHHILERRGEERFTDLDDFLKRCNMKDVGKRALESLIRVGALESLTPDNEQLDRAFLLANLEHLMSFSINHHKNIAVGQSSMFDLMSAGVENAGSVLSVLTETPPEEWTQREQLRWERDLMGLYISRHPLDSVRKQVSSLSQIISIADIKDDFENNAHEKKGVRLLGLVAAIRLISTKQGQPMAIVTMEDEHGSLEVVVFPKVWTDFKEIIAEDKILVVDGRVEMRGSDLQIIATRFNVNFQNTEAEETYPTLAHTDSRWRYDEQTGEPIPVPQHASEAPIADTEGFPQTFSTLTPPPQNHINYGYAKPLAPETKTEHYRVIVKMKPNLNLNEKQLEDEIQRIVGIFTQHYAERADYLQVIYTIKNKTQYISFPEKSFALSHVKLEVVRRNKYVEEVSIIRED